MRIGDLRKKLAEYEANWTSQDDEVLGKFEDQEIIVPVYEWNEEAQASDFRGYARDVAVFWDITGLGLCIEDAP